MLFFPFRRLTPINNDSYTFKRYDKNNKQLIALNPNVKSIKILETDQVMILGVVSALFRDIRI